MVSAPELVEACTSSSVIPSAENDRVPAADALGRAAGATLNDYVGRTEAPSSGRRRIIRFSAAWDVILLKALSMTDAHVAPHWEAQNRFQETVSHLVAAVQTILFASVAPSTWKTLSGRFKRLLADHRYAGKQNVRASGIIEVRGRKRFFWTT